MSMQTSQCFLILRHESHIKRSFPSSKFSCSYFAPLVWLRSDSMCFQSFPPPWPGPVRTLFSVVGLHHCPALLSRLHSHWYAESQGRALPPIHLETRTQTQEFLRGPFHFVALNLGGLLETSRLLRAPQILFLTLDRSTEASHFFSSLLFVNISTCF